jgi:cell division protein FtsB
VWDQAWQLLWHSLTNFGTNHVSGAIFGFFGIGGLLALLAYLPIVGPMFSAALQVFSMMLESRIGVALVAGSLCFAVGDTFGRELIQARWKAADLVWQREAEQRDKEIEKEATEEANARAAELEKENEKLNAKVKQYEEALAKRPLDVCRITDIDVQWLRQLEWAARSPKPARKPARVLQRSRASSPVAPH